MTKTNIDPNDIKVDDDKDAFGVEGAVSQSGRDGGRLARKIGTRDELKRAFERPAGITRVRKSDEADSDR